MEVTQPGRFRGWMAMRAPAHRSRTPYMANNLANHPMIQTRAATMVVEDVEADTRLLLRSTNGRSRYPSWISLPEFIFRLSGPVLRDTARLSQRYPPIARYGVFGVSTWPIGCDTPSPFSECFPLGEHAKWRCDTPPSKGVSQRYLRDTL